MANRSVTVTLRADVANLVGGMQTAAQSVESSASRMLQAASKNEAEWSRVGNTFLGVGAAIALGLGASVKQAMTWESAFAGVKKTVDDSAAGYAALEQELRGMARTMATSHTEIAQVAENAGQLGIAREDIADFTRTMVILGETTNLTADEAATSLAQMMNVMQTAPDDVDNLAAAIVALGNDGASTERDIVQMAQRIAAAGNQVGLSEPQVLAFASTLASVGIEAEAGGTAISLALKKMDGAVREGGESLETLARVSGMSSAEFRRAWGEDAAAATTAFVEGLGRAGAAGQDTNAILRELGITGIRESDALLRLAGAGGLLAEQLTLGNEAFADSTAHLEEYAKRAATTESQTKIAMNNIVDSMITAGTALLPVVAKIAEAIAGVAQAFADLPAPVVEFGMLAAASVGGLALLAGGFMKAVTAAQQLRAAMLALNLSAGWVGLALTALSVGIALIGGAWLKSSQQQADAAQRFEEMTDAIAGSTDAINEQTFALQQAELQSFNLDKHAAKLGISFTDLTAASMGSEQAMQRVSEGMQTMRDRIAAAEAAGSGMVTMLDGQQVSITQARGALNAMEGSLGIVSERFEEARAKAQEKRHALEEMRNATEEATGATDSNSSAQDRNASSTKAALEAMQAYANLALQLSGSLMGLESALDAATDSVGANGQTLDITTEKGRNNQQALDNIALSAHALATSMNEAGESSDDIAAKMQYSREQFIAAAEAMGMLPEEAAALADAYGLIPEEVATEVRVDVSNGTKALQEMNARIETIDGQQVLVTLDADGQPVQQKLSEHGMALVEWGGRTYRVTLDADGNPLVREVDTAQRKVDGMSGNRVPLDADGNPLRREVDSAQRRVTGMHGNRVVLNADGSPARAEVSRTQSSINAMRGKTITVRVNTVRYTVGGDDPPVAHRASGGLIPGWSPHSRADNIHIMATANEFMQPVDSVRHYGLGVMEAIRRKLVDRDALLALVRGGGHIQPQRLANGGMVGAVRQPASATRPTPVSVQVAVPDAAGASTITIPISLDGREIARAVHAADAREGR